MLDNLLKETTVVFYHRDQEGILLQSRRKTTDIYSWSQWDESAFAAETVNTWLRIVKVHQEPWPTCQGDLWRSDCPWRLRTPVSAISYWILHMGLKQPRVLHRLWWHIRSAAWSWGASHSGREAHKLSSGNSRETFSVFHSSFAPLSS